MNLYVFKVFVVVYINPLLVLFNCWYDLTVLKWKWTRDRALRNSTRHVGLSGRESSDCDSKVPSLQVSCEPVNSFQFHHSTDEPGWSGVWLQTADVFDGTGPSAHLTSLLTCRHGDRQHAGVRSAGGGRPGEGEGGHVEASPPSEREEPEEPDPAGSILRRHRQETLRPPFTGTQRWDRGALVILIFTPEIFLCRSSGRFGSNVQVLIDHTDSSWCRKRGYVSKYIYNHDLWMIVTGNCASV